MNDMTQTLLRSVLKYGAGYLACKGYIDADDSEKLISALMIIAGVLWGIYHRTGAKPPRFGTPVLLALTLVSFTGCALQRATTTVKTYDPATMIETTTTKTVTNAGLIQKATVEGFKSHYETKSGSSLLSINKESAETQTDAIEAFARGATKGAVEGAAKAVKP